MLKKTLLVTCLAAAIVGMVYAASTSAFLADVRRWGYDLLVCTSAPAPQSKDIVVVDFDDETVLALRQWPIARSTLAEVVRKIGIAKPDLIGLDILLSEPRSDEGDRQLADAIAAAGNVIIVTQQRAAKMPAQIPLPIFCVADETSPSYCRSGAALGLGYANIQVDDDGFLRHMYLIPARDSSVLSFPVALAMNRMQKPLEPGLGHEYRLGPTRIPLDDLDLNTALIGAWNPDPAPVVSAHRLLTGDFDPRTLAGKIVIIGESTSAAGDRHITPLFRTRQPDGTRLMMSGTQIQAAALNTLLTGHTIHVLTNRTVWSFVVVFAVLGILAMLKLRPAMGVATTFALMLLVWLTAHTLYSVSGQWFDYMPSQLALLLAIPVGFAARFVNEKFLRTAGELERSQLRELFDKHVGPAAAEEIWNRRDEVVLTGKEMVATVLFSDIRDFTKTTAGKPSSEVLDWLNHYFDAMADEIEQRGGYLNKFIGDGIMAIYGVPISHGQVEDACAAVETALGMLTRVRSLVRDHQDDARFPPELRIGVGIHTGVLTAGNVGAHNRMEYSVIGETVNLASRMESVNSKLKIEISISPSTYELVKDRFSLRRVEDVEVKGFEGKVTVYTVAQANAAAV